MRKGSIIIKIAFALLLIVFALGACTASGGNNGDNKTSYDENKVTVMKD